MADGLHLICRGHLRVSLAVTAGDGSNGGKGLMGPKLLRTGPFYLMTQSSDHQIRKGVPYPVNSRYPCPSKRSPCIRLTAPSQ